MSFWTVGIGKPAADFERRKRGIFTLEKEEGLAILES